MAAKKPLIGVTTSSRKGLMMWWFSKLGVRLAGGRAVRISVANRRPYEPCDGYIISGGVDIDPKRYGEENRSSVNMEDERDDLETLVISHALKHKKPLMGICRGAQMINVVGGGTLHQDAPEIYKDFAPTDSVLGKIFARRKIHISKDSYLFFLLEGRTQLRVNSLHHQAINKLGEQVKTVAEDKHGIVQAIESRNREEMFILGVQWHPEFMPHSALHRRLFKALLKATRS
ncbi:MAG: type 1 glutamine amidotransferase [Rhodobacteraceae bacterium]|nr:type 1 glutamine amidotransferase [Paracoccaceae bacterium]